VKLFARLLALILLLSAVFEPRLRYRRICAWCHKDMGAAPSTCTNDTHGICDDCEAIHFPEERAA